VSPAAVAPVWRTASTDVPKKQRAVLLPDIKRRSAVARERPLTVEAIEEDSEVFSEDDGSQDQRSVRMYCISERLDLLTLQRLLRERLPPDHVRRYPKELPQVICSPPLNFMDNRQGQTKDLGSIFYFEYGVIVFWCTSVAEEIAVLRDVVASAEIDPVKARDVTWDQFAVNMSSREQPSVQNDIITISRRAGTKIKLSVSHALAQSTKLLMLEKEVQRVAESTRYIPEEITRRGSSSMKPRDLNRLTGDIFMKSHAVNLVNPIMGTPEWLEQEPDDRLLQTYKRLCLYLGMHDRVTIVNNRLECLKDLLALLRAQHHDADGFKLETIVILLLVMCVVLSFLKSLEILSSW